MVGSSLTIMVLLLSALYIACMQERVDRVGEGQTGEDFLQSLNRRRSGRSSAENYRFVFKEAGAFSYT